VTFISYEPNRVVIETSSDDDGYLVLTDTYAQGWQASIDDRPSELYIADHAFRAVRVPAGQHRVEFAYKPLSFSIGAALSLIAVACVVVWGAVLVFRGRR
jgi:uncharacterized membrane protein YfhO